MPAIPNSATGVHACFGRTSSPPEARNRAACGLSRQTRPGGAFPTISTAALGWLMSPRTRASASAGRRVAHVDLRFHQIGNDIVRDATGDRGHRNHLSKHQAVEVDVVDGEIRDGSKRLDRGMDRVVAVPWPGAVRGAAADSDRRLE